MRAIKYVMIHAAWIWAGVAGELYHIQWAHNIFVFWFWMVILLGTICVASESIKAMLRAKGRSVPAWVDHTLDLFILMALAASGHFWMAGFWAWQAICSIAIYAEPEPENSGSSPTV